MHLASTVIRSILAILLMVAFLFSCMALAGARAPVVVNYQDPETGAIVSYVGIPGGPVVYSSVGPGGVNSVTSVNAGNPLVYSKVGPGGITSISYAGNSGPAVFSTSGPGGVSSVTFNNPGRPVIVLDAGSGTAGTMAGIR